MKEVEFKIAKIRGFEVCKGFEEKNIELPIQMTTKAAGYDFEAAETITIPSLPKKLFTLLIDMGKTFVTSGFSAALSEVDNFKDELLTPTVVSTGIKCYMQPDEVLNLYGRSSNPLKRFLLFSCGVGIIDADFYENEKDDGHIRFQFINFSMSDQVIEKGERIGQGVFHKVLKADNNKCRTTGSKRKGGHGSTDEGEQ